MNAEPTTAQDVEQVAGCRRLAGPWLTYAPLDVETPGRALTADVTGEGTAPTLGAGVAMFEDINFAWTHPCDEAVYVISGELIVSGSDGTVVGRPGDLLFMTRGARLTYSTQGQCRVFAAMNLTAEHLAGGGDE